MLGVDREGLDRWTKGSWKYILKECNGGRWASTAWPWGWAKTPRPRGDLRARTSFSAAFLKRTASGRVLTERSYQHFNVKPPPVPNSFSDPGRYPSIPFKDLNAEGFCDLLKSIDRAIDLLQRMSRGHVAGCARCEGDGGRRMGNDKDPFIFREAESVSKPWPRHR